MEDGTQRRKGKKGMRYWRTYPPNSSERELGTKEIPVTRRETIQFQCIYAEEILRHF